MSTFVRFCSSFLLFVALALPAHTQIVTNPLNESTLYGPQPFSSLGSSTEAVNNANGNVSVSVPLLYLPGINGLDFALRVNYNSKNVDLIAAESGSGSTFNATLQWQSTHPRGPFSIPYITFSGEVVSDQPVATQPGEPAAEQQLVCNGNWIYTDENGAPHSFNNLEDCFYDTTNTSPIPATNQNVNITDAADSSFLRLDTTTPGDIRVLKPNGDVVNFALSQTGDALAPIGPPLNNGFATSIVDPNGNSITIVSPDFGSQPTTITDSLGRVITITSPQFSSGNYSVGYEDANGIARTITVSSQPASSPDATLEASECQGPIGAEGQNYVPADLTSDFGTTGTQTAISIPTGNGAQLQTYTLLLDSVGEPIKVTYPSGGYTRYSYTNVIGHYHNGSFSCALYGLRELQQKSQCRAATGNCASEDVTTFTPVIASTQTSTTNSSMTVVDPPDAQNQQAKTLYNYSQVQGKFEGPFETSRSIYSGTGTLLETITTSYNNGPGSSPPFPVTSGDYGVWALPQTVSDTKYSASGSTLTNQTNFTYSTLTLSNAIYNNATASFYYPTPLTTTQADFNGTVDRTTTTTPQTGGNYAVGTGHILDRAASTVVSDASITSSTAYGYDTNGNVTSISKGGSRTATETTSFILNSYGQIQQATDPKGNITTYSYTNAWLDSACPTTNATASQPSSIKNALGQTTTSLYYSCTGQVASVTDANSEKTSYVYDALSRPYTVSYPDGGMTTSNYTDSAPLAVETVQLLSQASSPGAYKIKTVNDGLGRPSQSQLESDPSGVIYTDTTYDALGRVNSVSNPYRSTSDLTYGLTTYLYDGLGRETLRTLPDNTTIQTCYNGVSINASVYCSKVLSSKYPQDAWVDVTDENGHHRQQVIDGLGRLVSVLEPDPSLGSDTLETDYQNDALNDLLEVDQWGGPAGGTGDRVRLFQYDGIGRLLSTQNPETGMITYSHVTHGGQLCSGDPEDVCFRTDARSIETDYSYDSLNRLTGKTYSDGTLPVTFIYDQTSGSVHPGGDYGFGIQNLTNGVGRLTSEYVGTSAPGVAAKMFEYDAVGRETDAFQCFNAVCTNGTHIKNNWHTYDLAGDVTYVNDGFGNGKYITYDSARRVIGANTVPQSLAASEGVAAATLVSSTLYGPLGPTQITFGDGQVESFVYDKRGRTSSYQRNNEANPGAVDYGYNLSFYPNGNVQTAVETFENGTGTWQYGYDNLDRLTSATNSYLGEACAYGYDNFGNRLSESPTGTGPDQCFSQSFTFGGTAAANPNAIAGYCYDASGDLLDVGACPSSNVHNYTYDGEGRLASANYGNEVFTYDADGRRVGVETAAGFTNEIYDELTAEPLLHFNTDGSPAQRDLWLNGRHIAYISNSSFTWTATDWIGSERLRTDSSSNLVGAFENLSFGDGQITLSGGDDDLIHFTGKERDTAGDDVNGANGLDYFGARLYSSTLGRFVSPDYNEFGSDPEPIPYADYTNPQSLNLYSYAYNNPLTNTDSDGHLPCGGSATISINVTPNGSSESQTPDCDSTLSFDFGPMIQFAHSTANVASQAVHQVANIMTTPGGPGCLADLTGSGAGAGAAVGAEVGLGGLAGGGVGVLATEPAGLVAGGIGGGAAGFAAGMSVCPGGAAFSGNGGGGGKSGASAAKKIGSNSEADKIAQKGGYRDAHDLKEQIVGPRGAQYDLYKQPNGDIELFGRGGVGEGIETGINVNR